MAIEYGIHIIHQIIDGHLLLIQWSPTA